MDVAADDRVHARSPPLLHRQGVSVQTVGFFYGRGGSHGLMHHHHAALGRSGISQTFGHALHLGRADLLLLVLPPA